ncbi:hypothetical protein BDZ45DRAFT_800277 [Acephala macrosclerotiorum]|nr:hypothetical protein BDZ45DRAFT_800277 [Acephala macrosclerotiorum]
MSAPASSSSESALSTKLNGGIFYFSYGSNIWLDQMAQRCPHSKYLGIANVPGCRWIIDARGSANTVQVSTSHNVNALKSQDAAYAVLAEQEYARSAFDSATEDRIDVAKIPETVNMLVYINRLMTMEDLLGRSILCG